MKLCDLVFGIILSYFVFSVNLYTIIDFEVEM